jgi:DNA-directed RNA polymerase specialized sigma24 family protein
MFYKDKKYPYNMVRAITDKRTPDAYITPEMCTIAEQMVGALPEVQYQVIMGRYCDQKTYTQLDKDLGLKSGKSRQLFFAAMHRLHSESEKYMAHVQPVEV